MKTISKSTFKVLGFLSGNPSRQMYEGEVARGAGVSVGGANAVLKDLAKKGIVRLERKGRMLFYRLDTESPEVKQFRVFLTVSGISPLVEKVKEDCERIVLYGSCARGEDVEGSDVDLLFITSEKGKVQKELRSFQKGFPKKLSPVVVTPEEWLEEKSGDKPFTERVGRGIELWRRR